MGFNTAVMLCNDELHTLERSETFAKDLCDAASEAYCYNKSVRVKRTNAIVLPSEHADVKRVLVVGGNTIVKTDLYMLDRFSEIKQNDLELKILQEAANKLGYYLRKKPAKK